MKCRVIVPNAAAFIPKVSFVHALAAQQWIKAIMRERQLPGIKIEVIK